MSTVGGKAKQISKGRIQPRLSLRSQRQKRIGMMTSSAGGKTTQSSNGTSHCRLHGMLSPGRAAATDLLVAVAPQPRH